jgi:hypothetical protein
MQRPQQHGVDYTEDGRVRADAQAESRYRQQSDDPILVQHPRGEAQVSTNIRKQGGPQRAG